jgi:hypothetical protein
MVLGGMVAYPLAKAKEVLRFCREFNKAAPDELTTCALFNTPPDSDTVVALCSCYGGPLDKGEADVRRRISDRALGCARRTGRTSSAWWR